MFGFVAMTVRSQGGITSSGSRRGRTLTVRVESLEARQLMASAVDAFLRPDVSAYDRVTRSTSASRPPLFSTMVSSLQQQLNAGPVQMLTNQIVPIIQWIKATAPNIDTLTPAQQATEPYRSYINEMNQRVEAAGSQFMASVNQIVDDFEAAARRYQHVAPYLTRLLVLQGEALREGEQQWLTRYQSIQYVPDNAPSDRPYYYLKNSTETVTKLVYSRPLWPVGTPMLSIYQRADAFVHTFQYDVVNTLPTTATDPNFATRVLLVQQLGIQEAETFRTDYAASLTTRPVIRHRVDRAINQLQENLAELTPSTTDAKDQASKALGEFQTQIMVGAGLFGAQGPLRTVFRAPVNPFPDNFFDYGRMYTFLKAKVEKITLTQTETFTRFFSDPPRASIIPPANPNDIAAYLEYYKQTKENNVDGAYMSADNYFTASSAIAGVALDQSWFHPSLATIKSTYTAPTGTVIYVGLAAPIYQGILRPEHVPSLYPGLGDQTVILSRSRQGVTFGNARPVTANP